MKKLYLILSLICISFSISIFSQDGWFWLNPLPQGNWLTDVEFTSNNTVYVSGYGGTMMKSTDGGNNFVLMENKECGSALVFLDHLTGFSSATNGILKTTNGGNNWRYIPAPVDYVYNYSTTPLTILYGIKDNKVYLSSDMGESWSLSLTALTNNTFTSIHFPDNSTGYTAGYKPNIFNYGRLHKTTNGGITWDTIPLNLRHRINGIFFLNANTGFMLTYFTRSLILKTTNGGYHWDTSYNIGSQFNNIKFFDVNTGYASFNSSMVITTNQGSNWTNISADYILFLKDLSEGIGIHENHFYRTTNLGINWIALSQGFMDNLYDVTFINAQTGFTCGYDKILKTTNAGINWQVYSLNIEGWPPFVENIMFPNENTGYAGIDGGRVAKTTNCGLNWLVFKTGQTDHLHGMTFPSVDTGYAVTKYGSCIKTTNAGLNWNTLFRDTCYYDKVEFWDNNTGFTSGYNHNIDKGITKITTNGGMDWQVQYNDSIKYVTDIDITEQNSWYYSGYGDYNGSYYPGYIYRSTDQGKTWTHKVFNETFYSIYFSSALTGYASCGNNIMRKTTDGGLNWFNTYSISYGYSISLCFINDQTGYGVGYYGQIIKTTTGGGVLISVEPQSYVVPRTYNLYQNYPNPFNPTTKIKFDIPKAMNASLKIYDIIGREVSVIVNDFLIPGTYAFDFNGSNLSSGVYFYVLTGEGFVESKKMLLVK